MFAYGDELVVNPVRRSLNEFKVVRTSLDELIRKIKSTKNKDNKNCLASQAINICERNKWYDDAAHVESMVGRSKEAERYRRLYEASQRRPATFLVTNDRIVYEEKNGEYNPIGKLPPIERLD